MLALMPPSDIFHYEGLTYWGPMSSARVEGMLDLLPLQSGDRVLDIGCGRAEVLVRLVEKYSVDAVGVDRSTAALALARAAHTERVADAALRFVQADAREFSADAGSFAAVVALGGPHLGVDVRASWRKLASWVRPGGYLLLGEGVWTQPPDPAYLQATGIPGDEMLTPGAQLTMGRELGLTPLYTCMSSRDEWDQFEGRILYNVERYATSHPEDPDIAAMVERRRRFYDAQQSWGRDTMGFVMYLLHKPSGDQPSGARGTP